MDASAVELRRQQRARELREMNQKLEELKRRNAGAGSGAAGSGDTEHLLPLDQLLQGIELPDLDKLEADAAAAAAAAAASKAAKSTTGGAEDQLERSTRLGTANQSGASQGTVTPAAPIMYSKGIQTIARKKSPPLLDEDGAGRASTAADNEAPDGSSAPTDDSSHRAELQKSASSVAGPGPDQAASEDTTTTATASSSSVEQQSASAGTVSESVAKAIMASPEFAQFVASSAPTVERALHLSQKHEYLDVLVAADAAQLAAQHASDADLAPVAVGEEHALFDPRYCKRRAVTALAWTEAPTKDLCVVGYSVASGVSLDPDGLVCVWSPDNLLGRAEFVLRCHSAVTAVAAVNGTSGSAGSGATSPLIVAGTYSGQVVMWDLRAGPTPVQRAVASAAAGGHTHPIYSLAVTGTADSPHIATCSTDGHVCFWALDSFTEPLETLDLVSLSADAAAADLLAKKADGQLAAASTNEPGGDGKKGGTDSSTSAAVGGGGSTVGTPKADESTGSSTSGPSSSKLPSSAPVSASAWQFSPHDSNVFFVGSEEGQLYSAVRHGAKRGVNAQLAAHAGPITALDCQRASLGGASARLLLSTSVDWSCKLWTSKQFGGPSHRNQQQSSHQSSSSFTRAGSLAPHGAGLGGLTEPLLSFDDADAVMDARWSPVQPSVFATAAGSNVSLWNLLHSTEVPVAKQSPTATAALNRLCWSRDGSQLAVGDTEGYVHLFSVGSMHKSQTHRNQKKLDRLLLDLEAK